LEYCPTADMLADGMTKPLARPAFEDKRKRLGIVMVQHQMGINQQEES